MNLFDGSLYPRTVLNESRLFFNTERISLNSILLHNFSFLIVRSNVSSVPLEPTLRSKWIKQIQKHQKFDEIPIVYPVCADHFNLDDMKKTGKRMILKKGSLPIYFPE